MKSRGISIAVILEAWNKRRKAYDESEKLYIESDKSCAAGDKLCKMRNEGNLAFYNAVWKIYGNTNVKWEGDDAIVDGVRYEWEPKAPQTQPSCDGKEVEIDGKKYQLKEVK
jgi:hypothetical protein